LEDYDNLENLVDSLQPDDKLLLVIGDLFAAVGMGQQAVEAYTKVNLILSYAQIVLFHLIKFPFVSATKQVVPLIRVSV